MPEIDMIYLRGLCAMRDQQQDEEPMSFYYQGRIDEYCRQNALSQEDMPPGTGFDLNLPTHD